jgi:uncharacterized repeat protein (TIGR03803 family)
MRTTQSAIMQRLWRARSVALALTIISLVLAANAGAQTETVLFSITGGADGVYPFGGVISDAAGNFYGTTEYGGVNGACCGSVWEISPASAGGYTETVLHTFTGGTDGATSYAGLVLDAAGNVYGTTSRGGNLHGCGGTGCGVVFEFSPNSSGGWSETILHNFTGEEDGGEPWTSLIFDAAGNLYGTTYGGGSPNGGGVVFKLSPNGSGGWSETVLHTFSGGADGGNPFGTLTFDAVGNLYGTTTAGGKVDCLCGVVFELSPTVSGPWKETLLHTFSGNDGNTPQAGLVWDTAGNLYGSTVYGGQRFGCDGEGCGVIFELSPGAGAPWKYTAFHIFNQNQLARGIYPQGDLLLDSAGNVYGTGSEGGCAGVFFKLSPNSGGWTESVLHSFSCGNNKDDGSQPSGALVSDSLGNIYGATNLGGVHNSGTVYKITP